jgi:hypothetical protein
VQNIQSFLQNILKGNRVARFVKQDMPSRCKFFVFHLVLLVFRAESMFVLSALFLLVVMSWLDMSVAIRPVTVIANGVVPPVSMASFPSMETIQPERLAE